MIANPVTVTSVKADKQYRRAAETVHAVRSASFRLYPGRLNVLAGPSGSGKTTLLNLILSWETLDSGRIDGVPASPSWSDLAVVPQALGLLPHLTLAENVTLPNRGDNPARYRPDELLESLGLGGLGRRFPHETSMGQQQRAAVARALISGPRLIVMDEPSSHQDEDNTRRIVDRLLALADHGSTVLVATHDQRIMDRAHHRLTMSDGRVWSS